MAREEYGGVTDLDTLNTYQPVPAAKITLDTPVDSLGERYRKVVEFDLSSEEAYDEMVTLYPTAWDLYYEGTDFAGSAPAYSPEDAVRLQEAIKFYLYSTESETINVEDSAYISGIISDGEEIRIDAPRVSPYMSESGGTYENPDAFYNQEVYDRVTNDGVDPLPLAVADGVRAVSDRIVDKPQLSDMYSTEQLAMLEYEISRATPKSEYDHFGPYATGKNTY
jgi:hypothetical protein